MMNKHSLLLSIGTALLGSLLLSDVGHAIQTERRQDAPRVVVAESIGLATSPTAQLSNTPNLCNANGKGRSRAICEKHSLSESEERAADWSQYASAIFTVMLTIMLSTMIVLATFSLTLIVVAALSRRTPHQPLDRTGINLYLHEQKQHASYELADRLCESSLTGWPRRAWVVGLVWFIGFLGSMWFLWIAGSIRFFRSSNQTNYG